MNPQGIFFSQASISDPCAWDVTKYKNPIDVIQFGDFYTSLDNRRLFMAKEASVEVLGVNVYHASSNLNEQNSNRFQFFAAFCSNTHNCITITLFPRNYAAAVHSRCAMQKSDFPLRGTNDKPYIGRRPPPTHYWPSDRKVKREVIENIEDSLCQLRESNEIVIYLADGCPTIHNVEMETLLKFHLMEFFEVGEIKLWSNYMFLKAGGPDSKDWDENRNQEVDKLLSERENEILKARDEAYYAYTANSYDLRKV